MNWAKVSAIAEIISSVAILATLVYLALQTQYLATQTEQNTAAIVSNSRQQSLDSQLQVLRMELDYPVTAFGNEERASGNQGVRQRMVEYAFMTIAEHQWLQYNDGQLDPTTWRALRSRFVDRIRNNARLRQSWEQFTMSGLLDAAFAADVNEVLDDP